MAFLLQILWMPPGSVDTAIFLIDWLDNGSKAWQENQKRLAKLGE